MWTNPQFPADLATFTEEIVNEKHHFLYSGVYTSENAGQKNTSILTKITQW